MSWPANAPPARCLFVIELDAVPDALLRALGPFALHEAQLAALELVRREGRLDLRIEATGLDPARADHLGRKLRALPAVRGLAQGWLSSA